MWQRMAITNNILPWAARDLSWNTGANWKYFHSSDLLVIIPQSVFFRKYDLIRSSLSFVVQTEYPLDLRISIPGAGRKEVTSSIISPFFTFFA
jgi:hypothetical protein